MRAAAATSATSSLVHHRKANTATAVLRTLHHRLRLSAWPDVAAGDDHRVAEAASVSVRQAARAMTTLVRLGIVAELFPAEDATRRVSRWTRDGSKIVRKQRVGLYAFVVTLDEGVALLEARSSAANVTRAREQWRRVRGMPVGNSLSTTPQNLQSNAPPGSDGAISCLCSNGSGIPAALLEDAVREALRSMLMENQQATADLMEEKVAALRREHEAMAGAREDGAAEAQTLEVEIGRLVAAVASGVAPASVLAAIAEKEARVKELRARLEPATWNRADFFAGCRTIGGAWMTAPLLNPTSPLLGRQVLKKLGVMKITVTPSGPGEWDLDGGADLSGLGSPVSHGALGGPSRPPIQSIERPGFAGALPRASGSRSATASPRRCRA